MKLTEPELRWSWQLAGHIEKVFKLMGWQWRSRRAKNLRTPSQRQVAMVIRRIYRGIKEHHSKGLRGSGTGRIMLIPNTDEFGKLTGVDIELHIGSIPIEYQEMIWPEYGLAWNERPTKEIIQKEEKG